MKVSWSALALMLATHHRECGRPRYVRALVFYSCLTDRLFDTAFGKWLCSWFPAAFGAKAVICITCKSYAFESAINGRLLHCIRTVQNYIAPEREERDEAVLYDEEDVATFTDEELNTLGFAKEEA